VHIAAVNYVPYGTVYWERPYRNFEITQGLWMQKATHDLDYMSYLMSAPIVRVAAMAGGSYNDHPCVYSVDCGSVETGTNEDCSSAVVEFASGAHGVYTQVFYARRDAATRGATVSGYLGTLRFDWYTNELHRVRHHAPFSATERAGEGASTERAGEGASHFGGDAELAHDFIGLIRGTAASRTPIEVGMQSIYACLAAKTSAETGQFVAVRQVGG